MRRNPREYDLAQKYKIDVEWIVAAVDVELLGREILLQQAVDRVSLRLKKYGQPEPVLPPTCRICHGEYHEGVSGCGCPIHPSPGREWHGYVEYHKGGGPVELAEKEKGEELTPERWNESHVCGTELLPCKICGDLPKLGMSMYHNLYFCSDTGCSYKIGTKKFDTKEGAVNAWNHEFGKQSEISLLPCRQCEELPVQKENNGCFWHACGCRRTVVPEGHRWTEDKARKVWNKAFGRARKANDYPKQIDGWHVFVSGGSERCGSCSTELKYMDEVWKRSNLKRCKLCASEWPNSPLDHKPRSSNPHKLKHCECGEMPRLVAYKRIHANAKWFWNIQCESGRAGLGAPLFESTCSWWNKRGYNENNIEEYLFHRYDIPIHVTLGRAELPEEYRNPHNLQPCECGEIPKPVACKYGMGWRWAVGCSNGMISDARTTFDGVRQWWNKEGQETGVCGEYAVGFRKTMPKCYDLPTDVVLDGPGELPKEYEVVTTIR